LQPSQYFAAIVRHPGAIALDDHQLDVVLDPLLGGEPLVAGHAGPASPDDLPVFTESRVDDLVAVGLFAVRTTHD